MTKNLTGLLAGLLALAMCPQNGLAQFKQSAGDSIQDAIKASASDRTAQPAAGQPADDTGPQVAGDLTDLAMKPYMERVQGIAKNNWLHLIHGSEKDYRHRNGKTVAEFTITREGEVQDAHINQSSGQDDLDELALQCISLSNPFPALPKGFAKKELKVKFAFRFVAVKEPIWRRRP